MNLEQPTERAILIGINGFIYDESDFPYLWEEFRELARTAGAAEVGKVIQARNLPDPAFFIGSGKAEELAGVVRENSANLVVSIQELSPVQIRNLEDLTGVKVLDRTDLILDIFAQRAQTKEGKLQVELAQLNYLLPRLAKTGENLSRLGGGIGTRGPGETKLEVDRRRVRQRIADLRRELLEAAKDRTIQRHRREKNEIPTVALVGYTNAGKSTLFNRLTASQLPAVNRLFDTLDPVSRKAVLPNNQEVIFSDTVGFISNLPHQLVAAFKATLEETVRATLLLQVMDAGAPNLHQQYQAVKQVLNELGISEKESLTVLNKVDLLDSEFTIKRLAKDWSAWPVSALTGRGIEELIDGIRLSLNKTVGIYRFFLPFSAAGLLDVMHRKARVLEEQFGSEGVFLSVEMAGAMADKYRDFLVPEEP